MGSRPWRGRPRRTSPRPGTGVQGTGVQGTGVGAAEPAPVASRHLLPARRRIESAVAAARAELLPRSQWITVAVHDPDTADLVRALTGLADGQLTAAEAGARLGVPVTEPDLAGWVSPWTVRARGRNGITDTGVLPTRDPAEIAVDLADWLQEVFADGGYSEPVPPCPGHPHPMRPVIHESAPWWSCPTRGIVRAWRTHPQG